MRTRNIDEGPGIVAKKKSKINWKRVQQKTGWLDTLKILGHEEVEMTE